MLRQTSRRVFFNLYLKPYFWKFWPTSATKVIFGQKSAFFALFDFGDCFGPRYFSSRATLPQKNTSIQNNHLRFHTMTSKKMVRSYYCLIHNMVWKWHENQTLKKCFLFFWCVWGWVFSPDWPTKLILLIYFLLA